MRTNPTIGIQGYGMVGNTVHEGLVTLGYKDFELFDPKLNINRNAIPDLDVLFYCVNDENGVISDVSLIKEMVGKLVIIKTTLQIGAYDEIKARCPGVRFVYMPEFLSEATALHDFLHPDRMVLAGAPADVAEAYQIFIKINAPVFFTTPVEAIIIKLSANAYYALKVTFWNHVYDLVTRCGGRYERVKQAQQMSKFIDGAHMEVEHKGGRGFGGKCLPKDTKMLKNYIKGLPDNYDFARLLCEILLSNNKLGGESK